MIFYTIWNVLRWWGCPRRGKDSDGIRCYCAKRFLHRGDHDFDW